MKQLVKSNLIFYIGFLVWFTVSLTSLFIISKGDAVIWANQNRTDFLDQLFVAASAIVEVEGLIIFAILSTAISFKRFFMYAFTMLGALLVSSTLKKQVFPNNVRPRKYFENIYELNLIDGVNVHSNFSFPSGHTIAAFALFTFFALTNKNKWIKVISLLMALSVAFSRIYLSQHFLMDTVAGSILGVLLATVIYYYLDLHFLSKKRWANTPMHKNPFKKWA